MGKLKIGRAEDASAFDRGACTYTHACVTLQNKPQPPHPTPPRPTSQAHLSKARRDREKIGFPTICEVPEWSDIRLKEQATAASPSFPRQLAYAPTQLAAKRQPDNSMENSTQSQGAGMI